MSQDYPNGQALRTYWNGVPTPARKVIVRVGDDVPSTWWCAGLAGTERPAVEVTSWDGRPFFIDNYSGGGWDKVTKGMGGPHWGHHSLPSNSVVVREDA